jgi:aconitate hydratase
VISLDGLEGDFKPLSLVDATIKYADGTEKKIKLKARVDTEVEIEYLENGGVLHYVLRNLAKA